MGERKAHEGHKNTGFNYSSKRWKKVREIFIRQHPLCVACTEKELIVQASVVDHIVPISKGGSPWSFSNFQSLCKSCHDSKSAKEKE
jgi:5-methylcytosine-specific restriction protein A